MKKMLLATTLALLITGCAQQDVYCSKQTKHFSRWETITHHFFVSGIGRRKLSMQPKFVAAQKILLKRNPANIRKWIARFYYFRHLYSAGSACIAHNNCMSCPSIWNALSLLVIPFWVPSSCFCIVISLSLRVK